MVHIFLNKCIRIDKRGRFMKHEILKCCNISYRFKRVLSFGNQPIPSSAMNHDLEHISIRFKYETYFFAN